MKVVFIPGVGYQKDNPKFEKFLNKIKEKEDIEWEIFNWSHPRLSNKIYDQSKTQYNTLRNWIGEVILDFQHTLLHVDEIKVPEADVYMGHSAGSIIALTHAKKNCILFGSPLNLVELDNVSENNTIITLKRSATKVVNFVHKKDIIAFPIKTNVLKNIYVNSYLNIFNYSPIQAHNAYWKSKQVIKECSFILKSWKN